MKVYRNGHIGFVIKNCFCKVYVTKHGGYMERSLVKARGPERVDLPPLTASGNSCFRSLMSHTTCPLFPVQYSDHKLAHFFLSGYCSSNFLFIFPAQSYGCLLVRETDEDVRSI